MKRADRHPSKKAPGLFDQLNEALGISTRRNNLVVNLTQAPRKAKPINDTKFSVPKKYAVEQADLLFLPNDEGYRYALVVVDVATRAMDAEPLKEKKAEAVLKAFKKIYARKYLKWPTKFLQVDSGSEFKSVVAKEFKRRGIIVKVGKAGRHRQQAIVERMNYYIGRVIAMRQLSEELATKETAVEWVEDLPKIVATINKVMTRPENLQLSPSPRCKGEACNVLEAGTRVRVIAEKPMSVVDGKPLVGKFRAGDIRWEKPVRKIKQFILSPDQPPMYLVEGIPNVAYTRNQLQVVAEGEEAPRPQSQKKFIIESLEKRQKRKGKIHFWVKWLGYPSSQNTWEPRTELMKSVPDMVKQYEKKHKR